MSILETLGGAVGGALSGPFGGPLGGVANPVGGLISGATGSAAGFVLQGISSWVLDGTRGALKEVARTIGTATAPNLGSTWFSSTYWRVAALAAMLTIPFLCAAAVQAVARADLSLLARVTFGYLPVSILGVSLAAPLTMLLLAATDQMSAAVSASAATGGARFLDHAAAVAGALATATGGSPFFAVVVGLLALMAAMALAVELLVRAAAVYLVVLMLPLAFAALAWPARRVWAVRLVELLASLILSKFVIVAVLSLAAAAFTHGTPGIGELLVAMSLILLSTFAPWALMRILPFTELASGAAGMLRGELPQMHAHTAATTAARHSAAASELAMDLPARLRDQARSMDARSGRDAGPASAGVEDEEPMDPVASTGASGAPADPGDGPAAASAVAGGDPSLGVGAGAGVGADPGVGGDPGVGADPGADVRAPADSAAEDPRGPFVLPPAWRGSEPVMLGPGGLSPYVPEPTAAATAPSAGATAEPAEVTAEPSAPHQPPTSRPRPEEQP